MNPRFSIVIPVYNVAPYLRECLDSILAQTFTDWEAICVDDGSTDGSAKILDEYARKDSRFIVIHQDNAGVGTARNVAIGKASGEWLCFVDADDVITPNWLAVLERGTSIAGVDWLRSGCRVWNGISRPTISDFLGAVEPSFDSLDMWTAICETTLISGNVYRRAAITHKFDTRLKVCEDSIFEMVALRSVRGLCKFNWCGYYYRVRQGSASHVVYDASMAERYFSAVLDIVLQMGHDEVVKVSGPLTERLRKDVAFLTSHLRVDTSRHEFGKVRTLLSQLIDRGAIQYRYLNAHGDGLRWHLYFMTGRIVFLRTTGGFSGLVKILPYLWSQDIRWLIDFKSKFRELFCRA